MHHRCRAERLPATRKVAGKSRHAQAVINAGIIVNAAGAWADVVAKASGVSPLGIQPMRRTMAVLPVPPELDVARWPLISNTAEGWYAKPEAGRLQVSPDDEDPVEAHDAFVDDMVLAEGLYRFEQAMDFPVTRGRDELGRAAQLCPRPHPGGRFRPHGRRLLLAGGAGRLWHPDLARPVAACRPVDQAGLHRTTTSRASHPALSPNRFRN